MMDVRTDQHTHTAFSTGVGSPMDNVRSAEERGLREIVLTDHVHADCGWLDGYVTAVDRCRGRTSVDVRCGVGVALLDVTGRLDLPRLPSGVQQVTITDEYWPTRAGPRTPFAIRAALRSGELSVTRAVDDLVSATVGAVDRYGVAGVGSVFSAVAQAGLPEDWIGREHLLALVAACRRSGARIEVNERWRSPSVGVAMLLADAGVELVAASDARTPQMVGRFRHVSVVADVLGAVLGVGTTDEPPQDDEQCPPVGQLSP